MESNFKYGYIPISLFLTLKVIVDDDLPDDLVPMTHTSQIPVRAEFQDLAHSKNTA
jgi:hypothetical protein